LALQAVRKLLLADDSITIHKIVALTFADAGIEVVAVSNGTEAINELRESVPDIVLADVFMPFTNGYQVCEYVKRTEKLKHIPVMLLVGSFEPFDEAEARRVGADDILTKPFLSIRTLMDKVGALLSRTPAQVPDPQASAGPAAPNGHSRSMAETMEIDPSELHAAEQTPAVLAPAVLAKEAETKELPPPEIIQPPEEPMTTEELEITTADTQPLSPEVKERLEDSANLKAQAAALETTMQRPYPNESGRPAPVPSHGRDARATSSTESAEAFGDVLLDLGHFRPAAFAATDDVILDIDFDVPETSYSAAPVVTSPAVMQSEMESRSFASSFAAPAYVPEVETREVEEVAPASEPEVFESENVAPEAAAHFTDSDVVAGVVHSDESPAEVAPVAEAQPVIEPQALVSAANQQAAVTADQLSPEVIDAIARRVVEQMSERAVQEIAWEVVPQLADLMIKRKLEERETQNR
jgi:DNA-binding response OmpR family regulator